MSTEFYPGCEGEYEDDKQVVLDSDTQQKIVSGFIIADKSNFAFIGLEKLFGIKGGE